MKDQRAYFEKADFSSNFPLQVLTAALGLTLVLLELSLAQWSVFHGAAPNLSFIFIYYMMIYHTKLLPIFSIFRALYLDTQGIRINSLWLSGIIMDSSMELCFKNLPHF